MAFFRNFSNETVSQSDLEGKGQAQRIGGMVGNEDVDVTSSEKEFDINLDAQYESDGQPDDAGRSQYDVAADNGVNLLQPSGRRNVAGKWGSTFWKDCQPMSAQGAVDSGQDSKSDSKNADGSGDNISDDRDGRLESEDEEGQKDVGKGNKGHSDVPADEMLSDEYYEQDGEDQSDSMHYRGFSQSVGLNSRLQAKPLFVKNNAPGRSRALRNHEDNDDDDDNNNDGDADYEEEDEEDGNFFLAAISSVRLFISISAKMRCAHIMQ